MGIRQGCSLDGKQLAPLIWQELNYLQTPSCWRQSRVHVSNFRGKSSRMSLVCLWLISLLTWSLGWKRRSQTGSPVRPVRQARLLPLRSPSRFPATSFPPSALDWRPGIGCTSSLDVGGRRLQFGRNVDRVMCKVGARGRASRLLARN